MYLYVYKNMKTYIYYVHKNILDAINRWTALSGMHPGKNIYLRVTLIISEMLTFI